jgi:hypothetical protein
VLEDGDDETQAIAALLHGTAEDGGGRPLLARIRGEAATTWRRSSRRLGTPRSG